MEIERKFLINYIPDLTPIKMAVIKQSYIHANGVEVRIRKRYNLNLETSGVDNVNYRMCFKSDGKLSRQEVELDITKEKYEELLQLVNGEPIKKIYQVFDIDGYKVECSMVDSDWFYCEVEFISEEEANKFLPFDFMTEEVTNDDSYKMKNYWKRTRG